MRVKLDFETREEEFLYYGLYVAISSNDGKIIRDSEGFIYWDENEDDLVSILRSTDYNNFGAVYVEYPDDIDFDEN